MIMAAKKTPTPVAAEARPTLEHWLLNEHNVEHLKELVVDPVFLALVHYLSELTRVLPSDLTGSKALLQEEVLRKTAMHAGVSQILPLAKSLLNKRPSTPMPEAWSHLIPDNH